ncbi:MAG: TonB-dependent receptor [Acidimicrobiia bacterium]|nr:TonB-dependent receptor [Acidimicrobiia bacterium]
MRETLIAVVSVAIVLLGTGPMLQAQVASGTILGNVTDPSGAAIPGANVNVANVDTGFSRTVVSEEDGAYRAPLLQLGNYKLTVTKPGFRTFVRDGILLTVNQNARLDIRLEIGEISETVNVTGDAPLVETHSANQSMLVDSKRMSQLPLNGRNALDLQTLLPGVTGNTGAGGAENVGLSINGSRGTMNNYILDGGNSVDSWTNTPAVLPSPDALEEFSIVQFALSAEFGRGAGGTVEVVTKSGTNNFHGTLFEFLRNDKFNARSFFAPRRSILRQNQFGGVLGGPVIKDKTFFFGSYQATIQRFAATQTISSLPSDLERQGDFSQAAQKPIDPLTGQRFLNDMIPQARIDPAARKFIDLWLPKSPNGLRGPYNYNFPTRNDLYQYLVKIDQQLTSNNRVSGRYFRNNNERVTVGGLPAFVNHPADFRTRSLTVSDTHTFSPNLMNNFRFTFLRVGEVGFAVDNFAYADIGVKIASPKVNGKTWLSLGTQDFFADARRSSNEQRDLYQFGNTTNLIRGKHLMKFGVDLRRTRIDAQNGTSGGGAFSFGAQFSRVGFADFLLGLPTSFTQNAPVIQYRLASEDDFFFQDDFKVSQRLTLNLGLRFEPRVPAREKNGWLGTFRPGQKSTRFKNAPVGIVYPGDAGIPDGTYNSDLNNLAPRFGFAWDVKGDGRTSLRGGYGIFYDNIRSANNENQVGVEPFLRVVNINAPGSFVDPYGKSGVPNPFPFNESDRNNPNFVFTLPVNQVYYEPNFRIGYMQQWMLSLQKELARNSMVNVGYVGSKGTKLWVSRDLNAAVFVPGASTVGNIDARRPIGPNLGFLDVSESRGTSNYHALQLSYNKRYSEGFTVLTSYTWARSIDLWSVGRYRLGTPNPNNLNLNRGRSQFDLSHAYVGSFVWDLPFLRNPVNRLAGVFGGWQLTGIATLRSGYPLTIAPGRATSLSGTGGERADATGVDPKLSGDRSKNERILRFFNTSAFAIPPDGSWGNSGRSIVEGPGAVNFDFALNKNFKFFESHNIEFRAEAFNAFNKANFSNPNTTFTSPAFGRITSAGAGRVIQFALKYSF